MTAKKRIPHKAKKGITTETMKDNAITTQRLEITRLKGLLAAVEWKDANTYPLSLSCIPEGCLVSILDADKPLTAGSNPYDMDAPVLPTNYKCTHWRIIAKPPGYISPYVIIDANKLIRDICGGGDDRTLVTHKEVEAELITWIKQHGKPAKK